jgi:hypothetical protein
VAAANKIRLMYFWADESVMADDFRKKRSKKASEFARDFFGRYGFELDVKPGYEPGKVLESRRFALVKNDGVRPDLEAASRIQEESDKRVAELEAVVAEKERILEERRRQRDRLFERLNAAVEAHDHQAASSILTQLHVAGDKVDLAWADAQKVQDAIKAREKERDLELAKADYGRQFRQQLGFKHLHGITERKRLNVVFCRVITHLSSPRGPRNYALLGETFMGTSSPFVFFAFDWLFSLPFLCVSIVHDSPGTLAHEIVHAAGHGPEPPDQKEIKDLQKVLSYKPKPATGSFLDRAATLYENYVEYQSLFRIVPGGNYAGEDPNDIMNYQSDQEDPSAVNLAGADKKLLEAAFFVVP